MADQIARTLRHASTKDFVPVLRTPDHVILQIEHRVPAMPVFRHSLIVVGVERAAESGPPKRRWD